MSAYPVACRKYLFMLTCVWLFYRQFGIFTHAVSWAGWLVAGAPLGEDFWLMIMPIFWLKLISFGIVGYFMHIFFRHTYLFYQNLGYSVTRLFMGAFCVDMVLFFSALGFIKIAVAL